MFLSPLAIDKNYGQGIENTTAFQKKDRSCS